MAKTHPCSKCGYPRPKPTAAACPECGLVYADVPPRFDGEADLRSLVFRVLVAFGLVSVPNIVVFLLLASRLWRMSSPTFGIFVLWVAGSLIAAVWFWAKCGRIADTAERGSRVHAERRRRFINEVRGYCFVALTLVFLAVLSLMGMMSTV